MAIRQVGFQPLGRDAGRWIVPVEVRVPNILRPLAGGEPAVTAEGATLREVFEDLVRQYPGLRSSLLTTDGDMHRHLNVFLNDDDVRYLGRLDAKVGDTDTVTLMPAVDGG
jgi:molybdopterin converting factor small subunit